MTLPFCVVSGGLATLTEQEVLVEQTVLRASEHNALGQV